MSTSTISLNCFTLVKNWDTETLIIFLRDLNINLNEDDFKILCKQKIDDQTFSDMTKKKFMKDGIKRESAMKLEKQAKILKEKTRALKKGKIKYIWLFPCEVNRKKGHKPLADTFNLQKEIVKKLAPPKLDSLVSSTPISKK
ncbi:16693_t:CDS:2 [Funneliformis mosseae]|uniref:16693_t:CDS:1 n=1 Tax=Funneliformis mosseae TaxID=27381 RepID=A0A9N9C9L5_FUNMO|nr:16693_t:CDS:2 [Funneliformis mosseae]